MTPSTLTPPLFHKLGGGIATIQNIAELFLAGQLDTPEKQKKAITHIQTTCQSLLIELRNCQSPKREELP